jgi:glucosyl-dolichyl phosphate glucuronosyltransferase
MSTQFSRARSEPRMALPDLTIAVCTRNRSPKLRRCVQALLSMDMGDFEHEVLVVDNGSTDETAAMVAVLSAQSKRLRYLQEHQVGHGYARNAAWTNARAEVVAFIDDDAVPQEDWGRRIIEAFRGVKPEPSAVGGKIMPEFEEEPPAWFPRQVEVRSWGDQPRFISDECIIGRQGFSGSNMAFRVEWLSAIGGFRTMFGAPGSRLRMGEDSDAFERLFDIAPRFWYDPAIVVHHSTPPAALRLDYRFKRGFSAGRSTGTRDAWHTRPTALTLAVALLRILRHAAGTLRRLYRTPRQVRTTLHLRAQEWGRLIGYALGLVSGSDAPSGAREVGFGVELRGQDRTR